MKRRNVPSQRPPSQRPGRRLEVASAMPSDRNKAIMAEAVHRATCQITGTDGYAKCLIYALTGYALLAARGFSIQAGSLGIIADPDNPAGQGISLIEAADGGWERDEYHCWLARPGDDMVDFSSRHFPRAVRESMAACQMAIPDPVTYSFQGMGDLATDIEWRREAPPDSLWVTHGELGPRPLAIYYARADTTRAVMQTFLDQRDLARENVEIARHYYRVLGGNV